MKTTYFKTRQAIEAYAKEIEPEVYATDVNCDCGESYGYYAGGEKLVLCKSCYDAASNMERGE